MNNRTAINQVIDAIFRTLPPEGVPYELHEPRFAGNEWDYVKECLDTGWVSSVGKYVDRFEQDLADVTGVKRAVAVVNGTAALHVCLRLAGVEQGDEVLIPALTFVATANAVRYCGAVPHFVDSDERTLGMDPEKLDAYLNDVCRRNEGGCFNRLTGRRIKAVVPMHTFGHPVDLDPLADVCNRHGLALIEDAAESLGSYYKGRHTGNWGLLAALSFNGNKTITTGGGGAILTNDEALGRHAKHLTTTARVAHRWAFVHDDLGYNYRLPNINAALGCAQLEQLEGFLQRKRNLAAKYDKAFKGVDGVRFVSEPANTKSNYWLNALFLKEEFACERDALLEAAQARQLRMRPVWTLMSHLPMHADCPRMDLTTAESIERRLLNLPSSAALGDEAVLV